MARYHLACLHLLVDRGTKAIRSAARDYMQNLDLIRPVDILPDGDRRLSPSIEIQAHFEGVVNHSIAAADKLAEGIRMARGADPELGNSLDKLLKEASDDDPCIRELRQWRDKSIIEHARTLRNQAVHNYYDKAKDSEYRVKINLPSVPEDANPPELLEYCHMLLPAAAELVPILKCAIDNYGVGYIFLVGPSKIGKTTAAKFAESQIDGTKHVETDFICDGQQADVRLILDRLTSLDADGSTLLVDIGSMTQNQRAFLEYLQQTNHPVVILYGEPDEVYRRHKRDRVEFEESEFNPVRHELYRLSRAVRLDVGQLTQEETNLRVATIVRKLLTSTETDC